METSDRPEDFTSPPGLGASDGKPAFASSTTFAEAADALRQVGESTLPVFDPETGALIGHFVRPVAEPAEPPRLGGMATPLGVYLTDGVSSGGAGFWGLVLTGVVLGLVSVFVQALCSRMGTWADLSLPLLFLRWPQLYLHLTPLMAGIEQLIGFTPLLLVFVVLRMLPLAGTHAAEHQVVHCVERGQPVVPEMVRSMPRVHPRCGTNFYAAMILFLTIFVTVFSAAMAHAFTVADSATFGVILAAPVALRYWRTVGGFLQYWLATRPATDKQIESGIRAAREVLERRAVATVHRLPAMRLARRIWSMGLAQVLIGYAALAGVVSFVARHWPPFGRLLGI
ncbi:hypothetical protein CCAX7_31920 [Capsulimonas corticalis]|uniref:Uncharacterized protein n=1 Tax=Capsulimonas corticalis TaxID=2219043 RepID=A0A402D446_9BACT|nr:DUF1385 domain-containing protein [Capsulimonas corticalis]BDI31141.1 hypothetical protein CCAX7_31920 [Capsulimonas corticalis]